MPSGSSSPSRPARPAIRASRNRAAAANRSAGLLRASRATRYDGGGQISLESARAFSSPPSLRTQNARSPSVGCGGGFSRARAPGRRCDCGRAWSWSTPRGWRVMVAVTAMESKGRCRQVGGRPPSGLVVGGQRARRRPGAREETAQPSFRASRRRPGQRRRRPLQPAGPRLGALHGAPKRSSRRGFVCAAVGTPGPGGPAAGGGCVSSSSRQFVTLEGWAGPPTPTPTLTPAPRHDRKRRSRYAVRWLRWLLDEHEPVTIEEATLAAAALLALGGPTHEQAHSTLTALAEQASTQRGRPWASLIMRPALA